MGAFFTNLQVLVGDGDAGATAERVREVVLEQLRGDGFREAAHGEAPDRELLIVPHGRWVACYDARAEDQGTTIADWARTLSRALATDAFSVLVHDSDVLDLALFARGTQRNHHNSNPGFSGKQPSKVTPAAHAESWAHLLAPGHARGELEVVFAHRGVFAEDALDLLARALDIELALLRTGYNDLTRDDRVPASALRVRVVFAKRPAWERRLDGAPRFASRWEHHGMEPPETPPQAFVVGQPIHATAIAMNRGGAARGLRVEIAREGDSVALRELEVVVTLPGRFQMSRHRAPLVRDARGRDVAELPEVELQPGAPADPSLLVGAPMQAMLDAHHAGQVHVNIFGETAGIGATRLAISFVPLANPAGAHVERVVVDVRSVRGRPLRAHDEVHAYQLERLTSDAHTYLLLVLDEPVMCARERAIEVLGALRAVWPKGDWWMFATNRRHEVGDQVELRGALRDTKVWTAVEHALRTARRRVNARCAPAQRFDTRDSSSFAFALGELPSLALALATSSIPAERAERLIVPMVDDLARTGTLVQAVLARWQADDIAGSTLYESVVGIHGDEIATRGWGHRWIRGIGPGQLWLGPALRDRAGASALAAAGALELGPACRIAVDDVPAVEAALAALLPTAEDARAYARDLPVEDDD